MLVENIIYTDEYLKPNRRKRCRGSNAALQAAYERLQKAGTPNLHYVPGEQLLGDDLDATVDGTHPTDLGFMRMAEALAPVLKPLL